MDRADWDRRRAEAHQALPDALIGARALPDVLLPYQKELLAATAAHQLVVTDKSRRIGATWGVAADAVLTSAAARDAGGMDTLYLGYNLDMAREFIDTAAMWARAFVPAAGAVEEFLFEEQGEKGERIAIQAFRIRFASGFEIQALSSKPRSLRGRQGYVILDEFAFHDDAGELLKAAMALLIWGGKVLVISTHNGEDNPFNELIQEIREGRRPGRIVRVTFDDALEQGLYRRIALVRGKPWSAEAEAAWAAEIRGFYGDAAAEELDCVPSRGSGVWLSSALIEAAMDRALPVLRLTCPPGFEFRPDAERRAFVADWLEAEVAPVLAGLDPARAHGYGFDFARSGDLSVLVPIAEEANLRLRVPFSIELRNVPFRQQEQVVFHVADRLPRFVAARHDARGNGQFLAEYAQQRYGASRVEAVMLTRGWYLEHMPPLKAAFEDLSITMPADADQKADLRMVTLQKGIPMVPEAKTSGADGGQRHGDYAVALALAHAAIKGEWREYGYRGLGETRGGGPGQEDDAPAWWRRPLGAGLRGRI
jgi:phage FluMu gp28-like protein